MDLTAGQVMNPQGFHAPGAAVDAAVEVEAALGESPLGPTYRAHQDGVPLLLTLVDEATRTAGGEMLVIDGGSSLTMDSS